MYKKYQFFSLYDSIYYIGISFILIWYNIVKRLEKQRNVNVVSFSRVEKLRRGEQLKQVHQLH